MEYYVLINKQPVICNDIIEWASFLNLPDRVVGRTVVGDAEVVTIFLGTTINMFNDVPLLFETHVFGGNQSGINQTYTTWVEAEIGHEQICEMIQQRQRLANLPQETKSYVESEALALVNQFGNILPVGTGMTKNTRDARLCAIYAVDWCIRQMEAELADTYKMKSLFDYLLQGQLNKYK